MKLISSFLGLLKNICPFYYSVEQIIFHEYNVIVLNQTVIA